jgi:hypothetical protein
MPDNTGHEIRLGTPHVKSSGWTQPRESSRSTKLLVIGRGSETQLIFPMLRVKSSKAMSIGSPSRHLSVRHELRSQRRRPVASSRPVEASAPGRIHCLWRRSGGRISSQLGGARQGATAERPVRQATRRTNESDLAGDASEPSWHSADGIGPSGNFMGFRYHARPRSETGAVEMDS